MEHLQGKIIVVIGGSGFLGRYVVRRLAKRGAFVRIVTPHPEKAEFLRTAGAVGQITLYQGDITAPLSLNTAFEGASAVVNLVGILYEKGSKTFEAIHHLGARAIAQLADEHNLQSLVHVSALGANLKSPSAYARTKAAGEKAVLSNFTHATILRPSVIFGPEDQFFNRFAQMAKFFKTLPLIGGGEKLMQPVYVDNIAEAIEQSLLSSAFQGKKIELGGPKTYSFKKLMEVMLKCLNRECALIPLPYFLASFVGRIASLLPTPPLTADQVELLRQDNIVDSNALSLGNMGVTPTPLEEVIPTYLECYKRYC